ncbi:MAG: FAD-dependent oxidoreductase, partial [Actinobacteria bacterium]|nr:FAD-dependent oxidoreductase [Actinomycetota bacterium]
MTQAPAGGNVTSGVVDLAVIGGGVVGLALADAWLTRNPGDRVVVYDKENQLGAHASGRNSGVLHAG